MFGSSNGTKALLGGIAGTVLQGVISRRVAGRAAGLVGGGIPGMLLGLGATYLINRYVNRAQLTPASVRGSSGQSGR